MQTSSSKSTTRSGKRTISTSKRFLKIEQLPLKLKNAVEEQVPKAKTNHYHTSEGAAGLCLEASGEFLATLKDAGFTILDPELDEDRFIDQQRFKHLFKNRKVTNDLAAIREYIFIPNNNEEEIRRRYDDYLDDFPFDTDGVAFHFVVKVGEFIVDWTARQFGQQNPFPAIWRER